MSPAQDNQEDGIKGGFPGNSLSREDSRPADIPVIGIMADGSPGTRDHASAVRRAGGDPLDITGADGSCDQIDGLIVAAAPHAGGKHREAVPGTEACVTRALEGGLPVLATGEGLLTLNIVLGGSMVEVDGHAADPEGEEPAYHRIYIAPGGRLAAIVGSGGFVRVNSRHAHGIREAQKAPGLLATAYSLEDGVIEALESPEHGWVIGVQFDPQRRGELPPHFDRLFDALVSQARSR